VAVTRAREQVELVASIRSHEFNLADGASAGARMLRDYIAYAQAGGHADSPDRDQEEADNLLWPTPFEEEVAKALAEHGYQPIPEVGVGSFRIDIGVRATDQPDRFLLGIECDGDAYARTPTARDRERLRHQVLAQLGWGPIHRIWSLDWVRNRAAEIERMLAALTAAEARAASTPPTDTQPTTNGNGSTPPDDTTDSPRERVERVVHELAGSADAAALPWTTPYRVAQLRPGNTGYEFHESVNRRHQADDIEALLEVEAPISVDYAIRRLAENWGLQRAGHRVVSAARQAITQVSRRGKAQIRGEYIWRPDQTLTHVRIPDPADERTRRNIEDIPPEEIDLALARLAEVSLGIDDESLITQAARVLGFDRTGGRIRTVLDARLRMMQRERGR
jgi:hypothetical protein